MKVGILGGGLSGVTLQHFLRCDSEVLEKESRPGGLCRTFAANGFQYDVGGHILFSEDKAVLDVILRSLGNNINLSRRNSRVLYKGRFVKYPFENGLSSLDKQEIFECLLGYIQNSYPRPSNLLEWVYFTFGDGIADKYLVPYNRKIWKTKLEDMSMEWVERIPKPPLEDVLKSALGIETEGYLHQLHFYYPLHGGIESLIRSFLRQDRKLTTDFEISRIRGRNGDWVVSNDSETRHFTRLVLTFPLKEAVECFDRVPGEVVEAINNLRHNSVRVVLVGVNNQSLLDKTAIYIPSKDVIAHRVCYMGFFSPDTVPAGRSSLIAEVTTNRNHELYSVSDSSLTEMVIDGLEASGLVRKNEVIVTDVANVEYGYIIYDHGYRNNMRIITNYFASIGVELHGRFAEFEYINMDEVVRRSMRLAQRLDAMECE